MTCEKQFVPANSTVLYCSDACKTHDIAATSPRHSIYSTTPSLSLSMTPVSPPHSPYTRPFSSLPTPDLSSGPDILPRFSPTQSRPRSYFHSDPYPGYSDTTYLSADEKTLSATYHAPSHIPPSPPKNTSSRSSTALASLRELATALPKTSREEGEVRRTSSGVWDYMPFTNTHPKTTSPTPIVTPSSSYNPTSQGAYSQSYTSGGYGVSGHASGPYSAGGYSAYANGAAYEKYTVASGAAYGQNGGMGMDRPLPPRSAGAYGHRSRSIDLVTPYSGNMI